MDFDSLGWMKDIDLAEYLGINMHTVTFDDSKWKVDELLADLEKCFTGIKCTMCNEEDASYVNLGNNKYYCENDYISIIDHPEKFEAFKKMKDELKEDIIMIERCLFMIQERNHLLFHENLVLEDEECDFTHLMEALERNLDFFKNGIHNLSDNFKLARLLDVRSSSSKIKHIAMDIFKNAAELLAGLEIEMLLKNVKEESKHALTNKNSEEVKGDCENSQLKKNYIISHSIFCIKNTFLLQNCNNLQNGVHDLYRCSFTCENRINEYKMVNNEFISSRLC